MSTTPRKPVEGITRICLWALGYAVRRKPGLAAVLCTMLLKIGLDVLKPWPLKVLVDHGLRGDPMPPSLAATMAWLPGAASPDGLLVWCLAGTVVLFLLSWSLGVAASFSSLQFAQRMGHDLGADLFGHLQRLSLRFHSRKKVGDTVRRVTSDCGCVGTIVQGALLPVLSSAVALTVMFAVMWQLDPLLTLLSLAVVPGMILAFRRYSGPMLQRSYEQQEVEGRIYDEVEQTLSAMPVVQAFGREESADRRFADSTRATVRAALATTGVQLRFKILMGTMTAVGTAIILWIGATHALDGRLSVGSILVFLAYLAALYAPLESLMYTTATIQGASGSAKRVLEILTTELDVQDAPDAVPIVGRSVGHVVIEGVWFGYDPGRSVLKGVTLEARPGEAVALVGLTGAGKSTLAGLVPRLFDPWAGRVLLDGTDVRTLKLRDVRAQVGLVPQDPLLFPLSVHENVAYGKPGASRAEVEAACRAANAHEFVERLPEGYDTVVGPRGATLSGGERQRLAVARALLRDAPVLVLDEPTSALDAETEGLLLGAVRRLASGRTTLIIAHRLSTVRAADRIVVLHHGEVVEAGTHDELLATGGRYARLVHLQHGGHRVTAGDPA